MAGKISELDLLATPASEDMVEVLDVSDISEMPTGKNKRSPVSSFGGGVQPIVVAPMSMQPESWIEGVSVTSSAGLPGRSLKHTADANSKAVNHSYFYMEPFYLADSITLRSYCIGVESSAAGVLADFATYSVLDWRAGRPATLVANTKVTGVDISALGTKYINFGPTTLSAGCYWLGFVKYGTAGSHNWTAMWDAGAFFNGSIHNTQQLNGSTRVDNTTSTTGLPAGDFTVAASGAGISTYVTFLKQQGT